MKFAGIACLVVFLSAFASFGQTTCDYACQLAAADKDIAAKPGDGSGYLERAKVHLANKAFDKAIQDCGMALNMTGYGGTVPRSHYLDMVYDVRSRAYFEKGDWANVIGDLSKIIDKSAELRTKGSGWHWTRANAYFNVQNFSAALADYNSYGLYLRSRNDSPSEYFYIFRGETQFELKNYEAAITDLTAGAKVLADRKATPDHNFYRLRADAYFQIGKKDPAISDLTLGLAKNPKDVNSLYLRGRVFRSMGNSKAAIDDLTSAIAVYPSGDWIYAERGGSYWDRKEYDNALADYTKAIELAPRNAMHYSYRAILFSIKKEWRSAIADLSELIKLNPTSYYHFLRRANYYYASGDIDSAIKDAGEIIRLNPSGGVGYCSRAKFYEKKLDQIAAANDYSKAVEVEPHFGLSCRSSYYQRSNKLDLALSDALKAVEVSKEPLYWQHARVGAILLRQGKLEAALESLNKEIDKFASAEASRLRGEIYIKMGDYQSALAEAELVLTKVPNAYDGNLLLANLYRERGDLSAAAYEYGRAIEKNSNAADIYYGRALLNLRLKKTNDAVKDLEKTIELDPDHLDAPNELAKLRKQPTKRPTKTQPTKRRAKV